MLVPVCVCVTFVQVLKREGLGVVLSCGCDARHLHTGLI